MKKNKKKFIRNGALVCGGVILLGTAYVLGITKGLYLGACSLSDLITKIKTEGSKVYTDVNGERYLIKLIKEEQ